MTDAVRTPEELFVGLPDFPFEPHYREHDGLRLAHLDEGQGKPVFFVHGEPTWSFLWRKVIGPVRDAGFRCIAPDLPGFGRSDKPIDLDWYSYDRHVEAIAPLIEQLDLREATMVVHDWGGPIGLRLAVEHPDRVSRIVIMETGPFTGHQRMSDAWFAFRDFVRDNEDVPVGIQQSLAVFRPPHFPLAHLPPIANAVAAIERRNVDALKNAAKTADGKAPFFMDDDGPVAQPDDVPRASPRT